VVGRDLHGLQLTNFWQDVAVDWRKAASTCHRRTATLRRLGNQIDGGRVDSAWSALMRFEVERARRLLHSGAPLTQALPGRIGFELRLVVHGGLRILERIESCEEISSTPAAARSRDWLLMVWRSCRQCAPCLNGVQPRRAPHHDARRILPAESGASGSSSITVPVPPA